MVASSVIAGGAAVAVTTRSRLGAVTALGVVGYGIALVYVLFSAPDLAIAQILVETLTVLLFVLVFYHMPRFGVETSQGSKVRDATIAIAAGVMTLMSMVKIWNEAFWKAGPDPAPTVAALPQLGTGWLWPVRGGSLLSSFGAPRRTHWTRAIPPRVSATWVSTLPASVTGEVVPQIGSVGTTTGSPSRAR